MTNKKKSKKKKIKVVPEYLENVGKRLLVPIEVKYAISKVKKENYKNYFNYAYKKHELRKYKRNISTLRRKPKNYKE